MNNLFNSVKLQRPKSNVFDLSHDVKLSLDMGNLTPIMCMEAVPGDKFNIGGDALFRLAPMLAPMMHRVDATMHYWFVPNRLLWANWEQFITGNYPGDQGLPAFPTVQVHTANWVQGGLLDYLGIPNPSQGTAGVTENINAMPLAAYMKIFNDFYRDQNLQSDLIPPGTFPLVDGDNGDSGGLFALRKRAWEHDYFTSSLPFAQKGDAVSLPIADFNDVQVKVNDALNIHGAANFKFLGEDNLGNAETPVTNYGTPTTGVAPQIYAETSDLDPTEATINDLRRAFALQAWLERNARGGTRYAEHIKAHWGVTVPDYRLQRPEYIVGVKSPLVISEVLQTSEGDTTPQGNMAGHGAGVSVGKFGKYTCSEHGYVIGILSIMPKTAYQNGIERHWFKTEDPTQYFYPSFANIGEQEVQNREVFAFQPNVGAGAAGLATFGYVPRYAEYKFMNSRVCGDFRSDLDFWHMGRIFNTPPALNEDFISSDPTLRIFAVETDVNHVWAHVINKVRAVRMMPRYGNPSQIV